MKNETKIYKKFIKFINLITEFYLDNFKTLDNFDDAFKKNNLRNKTVYLYLFFYESLFFKATYLFGERHFFFKDDVHFLIIYIKIR